MKPNDYLGLSDEYWARLSPRDRELYCLVRPMPKSSYEVDVPLDSLPRWLAEQALDCADAGGTLELCPDFQRGHVWSDAQRVAFVEAFLSNRAEAKIRFNAPGYTDRGAKGDLVASTMQCIDGLQRLTALVDFVEGNSAVFGGLKASDLSGTAFSVKRYSVKVAVHEFANRAELLRFYLDINSGGTVHAEAELERVKGLLKSAENLPSRSASSKSKKP